MACERADIPAAAHWRVRDLKVRALKAGRYDLTDAYRHVPCADPRFSVVALFECHGLCAGKIVVGHRMAISTLCPSQRRNAFNVFRASDGATQEFEEEEVRILIVMHDTAELKQIIECIRPVFKYLDERITGAHARRRLTAVYQVARAFDPTVQHLTPANIDDLVSHVTPLVHHIDATD
ncbi:MAG: hypothetical protein SGPRY_006015 [Prymnesium sp.]